MTGNHRPNAYNMRGALPTTERMREEYVGTIYGAAALGYITYLYSTEMEDAMRERTPQLVAGKVKGALRAIGRAFTLMRQNVNSNFRDKGGAYWAADFGNAAYGEVRPHIGRLQTAVANHLGRYKGVADINVFARAIVAQSIASEAALYVERRQRLLHGYSAVTSAGRQSVPFLLGLLSMRGVCHHLEVIVGETVGRCVPSDTDLLADPSIRTGCKSVLNMLCDVRMWQEARDKADQLAEKGKEDKA